MSEPNVSKASRELLASKEYWDETWKGTGLQRLRAQILALETDRLAAQIEKAIGLCETGPTKSVLDCGCGPGKYAFWLADRDSVGRVVGLDFSDAIAVGTEYAVRHNVPNVHLMRGDIQRIPFENESFDFILSLGVIEHFESPTEPVLEMYRCLKEGGVLFLLTPNKSLPYVVWKLYLRRVRGDYQRWYPPHELKRIAERTGGEVLRSYGFSFERAVYYALRPHSRHSKDALRRLRISVAKVLSRLLRPWEFLLGNRWGAYSIVLVRKP